MPPFEQGEGGATPLLDLPQLSTVLEPETDSYPNVLVDTTHEEATLVLLAFRRALHNVPEDMGVPRERILVTEEKVAESVEASIEVKMGGVLKLLAKPESQATDRPAGVSSDATGLQHIPGFMEAAKDLKPETPEERQCRLEAVTDEAIQRRHFSVQDMEVCMLGLAIVARYGDRTAKTPDEVAASKIEADRIHRELERQIIELPAGQDWIVRIKF